MLNNNENVALKKYELNRNVFYIMAILTIIVVIIKLLFRKSGIFYYGLEAIVFLTDFVFLLPTLLKNKINLFSKNSDENIAIKGEIFGTMWGVAFLVYVIGPALIIIFYPQKTLFAGLYLPVWFIPMSYYIYKMLKNKNLINEKDLEAISVISESKTTFVIMGLLYGLGIEWFFSFFFAKDFNFIEASIAGTLFGITMYLFFKKCLNK